MQKILYDVSVVGGGPVGLAFLAALCSSNFHQNTSTKPYLLVDQTNQPSAVTEEENRIPKQRVIAISKSTELLLKSVGAWDLLQQDRVSKYSQMQIWESQGSGVMQFKDDCLGHIIEYDNIVQALLQVIRKSEKVDIYQPNELEGYEFTKGQYLKLKISGVDQEFESKLLVGSDGNKSKVKEVQKLATYGWQYNQMGVVCTVQTSLESEIAFQKYLKNGMPLALLPTWGGYYCLIWTVSNDDYQYLMKLTEDEFKDELNHALQQPCYKDCVIFPTNDKQPPPLILKIANKKIAFPLSSQQATRYVGQRVALIGDAAHQNHPLAGQGMNLGMNDAALLANCVIRNLRTGNDIGSPQALDEYESQAKLMNYTASIGIEGIKKVYEATSESLSLVRNLGVNIINQIGPLKGLLIQQAGKHALGPSEFLWEKQ